MVTRKKGQENGKGKMKDRTLKESVDRESRKGLQEEICI
jgi:hypothetical protein